MPTPWSARCRPAGVGGPLASCRLTDRSTQLAALVGERMVAVARAVKFQANPTIAEWARLVDSDRHEPIGGSEHTAGPPVTPTDVGRGRRR